MTHDIVNFVVTIEPSKEVLITPQAMIFNVAWRAYMMRHTLSLEEMKHIPDFINSIFK
jgi:hypothetical protein